MKKFSFPLERVMQWRSVEAQIAEGELQRLLGDLLRIQTSIEDLANEFRRASEAVMNSQKTTGADLRALDAFRAAVTTQATRLAAEEVECNGRIEAERKKLVQTRRNLRLLELLKQKRVAVWRADSERTLQNEADELHLLKGTTRP
jgi:flagellar export protein FliJ